MIFVLIFWLQDPTNYTGYVEYKTYSDCQRDAQLWNQKLIQVKSQIKAECVSKNTLRNGA